ncbi:MAG: hypothetical protein H0X30_27650 [Anaerolineae bacterium]|nr:hypothetical protein [Anaerolineae bacterium]
MNNEPFMKPPEQSDEPWETTVRDIARDFAYPPTPDIARQVRQRLVKPRRPVVGVLKWAVAVLLALTVIIIGVPQVRAYVVEIIRIGAIQIFVGQPTVTPTSKPAATGMPTEAQPTSLNLASALQMPNETTLDEANKQFNEPIQLPTYPTGIGKPDHVYVQHMNPGVLVTLVWLTPSEPDHVWLTLDVLNENLVGSKFIDNDGQYHNVRVNNTPAQWLTGLHQIGFFGGDTQIFRNVNGNVLIWLVGQYGKLTYRLEGASTSDEAVHIAESMRDAGTP